MNLESLRTVFNSGEISTASEDRLVYGRDASRLSGECVAVAWPTQLEQVAALIEWADQERVDLTPRGAGTGLCGGATPQHSIVVDLSRLATIHIDVECQQARVGAGVVLETLNRRLAPHDLLLPVIPGSHRAATIGGMIATNAAGLHAVRYGMMRDWVERVTLIDGVGRLHRLTGDALGDVVGREGTTGLIVEATVRLTAPPVQRTVSLKPFADTASLLAQRERWLADSRLTALEYLDRFAAEAIGWEPRPYLLAEFEGGGGDITDPARIAAIWRARDGLYPILARRGYSAIEDPQMGSEGLFGLLTWLDVNDIPAFGHLGVGIVHPCFQPDDQRVIALYEQVAAWGGRISGEHGIGLKKKPWVDAAFREEIQRLKSSYDPRTVINRGKLC